MTFSSAERTERGGRRSLAVSDVGPTGDAWRAYFETATRLSARLEAELKADAGLSLSDYNLLLVLVEARGRTLSMSALARTMVFSAPRLSYRVACLEREGWVQRQKNEHDARVQDVVLTESGRQRFVRAATHHRTSVARYFEATDAEAKVLLEVSARIAERLDTANEGTEGH